jgi:hypothetical protein
MGTLNRECINPAESPLNRLDPRFVIHTDKSEIII